MSPAKVHAAITTNSTWKTSSMPNLAETSRTPSKSAMMPAMIAMLVDWLTRRASRNTNTITAVPNKPVITRQPSGE